MRRQPNPGIFEIVKWGAIIGFGLWAVSKVKVGDLPFGDLLGQAKRRTNGSAQLVSVNHGRLPTVIMGSSFMDIEWIINHKGPAEHFTVGVALVQNVVRPVWVETYHADLWVNDDSNWRPYSTGITAEVTSAAIGAYLVGYIDDDNGFRIDERRV